MLVSESLPAEAQRDADPAAGTQSTLEVVALCAFLSAAAAALSGQEPTGTTWWDPLLAAALAGLFVGAAARANHVVLVAVAGLAAALVGFTPWLAIGLVGFGAALVAGLQKKWRVELQAVSGACTITALLHLRSFGFFGLTALIAGAAAVAIFGSWYLAADPRARGYARSCALVVATLVLISLAVAGIVGLTARATANEGIAAARSGLSSARAGDPQELSRQLELAADRLATTEDRIDSPLLKPALLIPVAAQHLRAVATSAEQGTMVATEAASAVVEADLAELQLRQGAFDLDLLTAMAPRLESVALRLETSVTQIRRVRTPWLLPVVDDRIGSLVDEVVDVLPEAQLAAEAAQVMPGLLGADAERRYLMLFGSPGESREFGGFVGGYAVLSVDDGQLNLLTAGSTNDLRLLDRPDELPNPDSYPTEFVAANPAFFPQNLTSTPNLETILRAANEIFPTLAGAPIDGLIYADPYALGAFTQLTGPITVPGIQDPLVGDGVADFIFDGQYRTFERFDRDRRFETIGALAVAAAGAFEQADLPGPERLGQILGPVARAGRLQVITNDERENAFLASVLLQRNFVAPTTVDSFALIQTNGTESKLDLYLHRDVNYDVQVDADGSLDVVVDVHLESIMADDIPVQTLGNTDGTNRVLLSFYSPHELTSLTVDDAPHDYVTQREFGFFRYALFGIELPPNNQVNVRLQLAGQAPTGPYRLGVWAQPLVNLDDMSVTYRHGDQPPASERRELQENWVFEPGAELD